MWVPTAYSRSVTVCDPSICFAVTSRVLTTKVHKFNKTLSNVENKKWSSMSFI
jgi:hypothetical protein